MMALRRTGPVRLAGLRAVAAFTILASPSINARNPIVAHQGVNDPHIHVYDDRAFL